MPAPKNVHAEKILPPDVLKQVMQYAGGTWMYVPAVRTIAERRRKHMMVRALYSRGMSKRKIAREVGYSEKNIRVILGADKMPPCSG